MLGHEGSVLVEDLQAVVGAIAHVDQAVLGDAHAVHRVAELLRHRFRRVVGRRLVVARLLAVGAPVPLVGAGLGIEHHHTAIGVAVRDVNFLGGGIDGNVGRRSEPVGRVTVGAGDRLADLQHELAVHGELEDLPVLVAAACGPDEIIVIDVDAVLGRRPIVALARPAPVLHQVAGLIEHQHRRGRHAAPHRRRTFLGRALALVERTRALHDPDIVEAVGADARDLAEQPVVRQRLRPERIDLELRHRDLVTLSERGAGGEGQYRDAEAQHLFAHCIVLPVCTFIDFSSEFPPRHDRDKLGHDDITKLHAGACSGSRVASNV